MPCGGPVHSLWELEVGWVCVQLGVELVPINRVAAILVSDLKATPLCLFLFLVIFLIYDLQYRNQKREIYLPISQICPVNPAGHTH